ncbi:hypothetical protein C2E23DRAFT_495490 [Lenzites betulinus]|nr:hypothetical protein C2E23DRAFT_495490 [Lenzites betulinus]
MIPKHSNPYLLRTEQTAIVSRAALRGDSEDEREAPDADPERAQMLARLENILKRSIEDVLPAGLVHSAGSAGGESPKRKKRRKVEEGKEEEDKPTQPVAVPFRLLSGMSQPNPIVLAPKAAPVLVSIGPAYADTKEEAKRRAARAREVAVDFAWVVAESQKPYLPPPNVSKKITSVRAELPSPQPPLVLLEQPKPTPQPPRISVVSVPSFTGAPSPHAHTATCCPIVPASIPAAAHPDEKKRKRRRAKALQRPAVQPAFWRPQEGMGGKSLGYAWGYEGSWPVAAGETPRYRRDEMRKGVLESE